MAPWRHFLEKLVATLEPSESFPFFREDPKVRSNFIKNLHRWKNRPVNRKIQSAWKAGWMATEFIKKAFEQSTRTAVNTIIFTTHGIGDAKWFRQTLQQKNSTLAAAAPDIAPARWQTAWVTQTFSFSAHLYCFLGERNSVVTPTETKSLPKQKNCLIHRKLRFYRFQREKKNHSRGYFDRFNTSYANSRGFFFYNPRKSAAPCP